MLERHWRMMGALEARDGMLLYGVGAAYIFTVRQAYWALMIRPHWVKIWCSRALMAWSMTSNRTAAAAALPLAALLMSSCVSQQQYQAVVTENDNLKAQIAALQAEQKFVEAGDLLFPEGGYRLSPAGQAELANNIAPKLKGLPPTTKIVVYGHTDNLPVGPALQQQGIPDNLVLSTRRAAEVVTFLVTQGVPPASISAKGFGDTRPVASNDTPQGRAQNRRIEITIQGPGA
jgi:chemotaxis protein MotB